MPSKERVLLERISQGKMSFAPSDRSTHTLERFQVQAEQIMESLDWLVENGFIGDYKAHNESHTRERFVDRIVITAGLTSKGKDKSQWPE
jgi:hypothetical protein